ISPVGILIAGENAATHNVADRLIFPLSEWYDDIGGRFDLIVSNPPYISAEDYEGLAPELAFEPKIALTPGGDGLDAYRQIAAGLSAHLTVGGRVLVEFGAGQGDAVAGIFRAKGLTQITLHKDLDARDRVLSARAPAA
ncbi:MAG: peptide chain release factor N(5)-glutamine methyltransferase, partial [Pseudomonadota bacterium]